MDVLVTRARKWQRGSFPGCSTDLKNQQRLSAEANIASIGPWRTDGPSQSRTLRPMMHLPRRCCRASAFLKRADVQEPMHRRGPSLRSVPAPSARRLAQFSRRYGGRSSSRGIYFESRDFRFKEGHGADQTLVVMLGWLGAQPKYLKKYEEWLVAVFEFASDASAGTWPVTTPR